jgi:hypothetical protein
MSARVQWYEEPMPQGEYTFAENGGGKYSNVININYRPMFVEWKYY